MRAICGVVLAASLAGCFIEPAASCVEPSDGAPKYNFDDPAEGQCGTWGFPFASPGATADLTGGELVVTTTGTNETAGCTSMNFAFTDVSFIEVTEVPGGTDWYVLLIACLATTGCGGPGIGIIGNGNIRFGGGGNSIAQLPYHPQAMRWLALVRSGGMLIGGYAAAPGAWTELGRMPMPDGDAAVSFQSGSFGPNVTGSTAFGNFNTCPR